MQYFSTDCQQNIWSDRFYSCCWICLCHMCHSHPLVIPSQGDYKGTTISHSNHLDRDISYSSNCMWVTHTLQLSLPLKSIRNVQGRLRQCQKQHQDLAVRPAMDEDEDDDESSWHILTPFGLDSDHPYLVPVGKADFGLNLWKKTSWSLLEPGAHHLAARLLQRRPWADCIGDMLATNCTRQGEGSQRFGGADRGTCDDMSRLIRWIHKK